MLILLGMGFVILALCFQGRVPLVLEPAVHIITNKAEYVAGSATKYLKLLIIMSLHIVFALCSANKGST